MEYTINELLGHLSEKVYNIRDTFIGFFGEDYVDMQESSNIRMFKANLSSILEERYLLKPRVDMEGHNAYYEISDADMESLEKRIAGYKWTIYVWWPIVTVTNENGRSVVIQDLYAKIDVGANGRIPYENHGFLLNRATYTKDQFLSGYMHSHISSIPKDDFTRFMRPCLGTGPIKDTILTLKSDYDEASWMLFCQELGVYVTVESLAGGPYNRMEYIGSNTRSIIALESKESSYSYGTFTNSGFTYDELEAFIKYYLQHGHLSIIFKEGRFQCGLSTYDYILDVSNTFIDFYNECLSEGQYQLTKCFDKELLMEVQAAHGRFYRKKGTNVSTLSLNGYRNKPVLIFKGKEIKTTITEEKEEEVTLTNILNPSFAMKLLHNILRIINFRFQNGNNKSNDIASAYQRVCYL